MASNYPFSGLVLICRIRGYDRIRVSRLGLHCEADLDHARPW
jgi:hypothetical protein